MAVGAPTVVGTGFRSTTNVFTGPVVVPAGGIPVGAFLVALASGSTTAGVTPTMSAADSRGNTWTLVRQTTQATTAAYEVAAVWVCRVTTALQAGDTITVTRSNQQSLIVDVLSVTGVDTAAPVSSDNGIAHGTPVTAMPAGAVTTAAGDLVLGLFGIANAGATPSAPTPSGAVLLASSVSTNANARAQGVSYRQSDTAGSVNLGVTLSASQRGATVALNLKAAAPAEPTSGWQRGAISL